MRCRAFFFALFAASLAVGPAWGDEPDSWLPEDHAAHGPGSVALVVAGGVSLGSYEAGYLHLLSESIRANRDTRLKMATGASAGSVNSLLALMDYCGAPVTDPRQSLGWRVWIPVGYRELFAPGEVTGLSVFTKKPLHQRAELLWKHWQRGLSKDCDVVLGVTATRLDPTKVRLTKDLNVPKQAEHFAIRIRGRGPGLLPEVGNYVDSTLPVPQPKLALQSGDSPAIVRKSFESLRALVLASAAFPMAFYPERLDFCMTSPGKPDTSPVACHPAEHSRYFVDGGVFDNTPLRLAVELTTRGLRRDSGGNSRWRGLSSEDRGSRDEQVRFVYLDPEAPSYPLERDQPIIDEEAVLPLVGRLVGGFTRTARTRELYRLAETQRELETRMELTRGHYPTVSGLLGAFMGFFEQGFREFDFYLGMYDAFLASPASFRTQVAKRLAANPGDGWRPFGCMLGWLRPEHEELRSLCRGVDRNQRVLLQVAIDRVFDVCAGAKPAELEFDTTLLCKRAAASGAHLRVTGLPNLGKARRRRAGESELHFVMRLLAGYRFHFRDLGLEPHEARFGTVKIRRKLLKMSRALARAQPSFSGRVVVESGLRTAINAVAYEPPRNLLYVAAGTNFEVGGSLLPFDWNRSYLRLGLALQLSEIASLVTPGESEFRMAPMVGVDIRPPWLANRMAQLFLGVRGGYQFGVSSDRFGARECTEERAVLDGRNCSQWLAQSYLALTAIDRVRLQVTFEYFPEVKDFPDSGKFDLQLGIGFQLF